MVKHFDALLKPEGIFKSRKFCKHVWYLIATTWVHMFAPRAVSSAWTPRSANGPVKCLVCSAKNRFPIWNVLTDMHTSQRNAPVLSIVVKAFANLGLGV